MNSFSHYFSAAILFLPLLDSASALGLPLLPLSNQDAVSVVEIQQVINLFAVVVDQHRWDLLSQVFHPDITADFNVPDSPVVHGLDNLIQLLRRLESYPSYHSQSSHYVDMSNPQRPHAVTYITGIFFLPERIYTNYGRCVKVVLLVMAAVSMLRHSESDTKMTWSEPLRGGGLLAELS